jgi:ribosomal protein L25 (general stress protein Ctc)
LLHAAFFVFEPNQSYIVIQLNSNMKALYIFLGLGTIYIVFQSFIANSAVKTEKQKYRTVVKDDELEIRYYPAATMATVYSSATNYKSVASSGFGKLARFIFGGNKENVSIAMTAPVRMNMSEKGAEMSFVMPTKYNESNLPKPNDESIRIHESAPQYVAVVSFGGYANDEKIKTHKEKLLQILSQRNIKVTGDYTFLGYNAPYQMIARTNEIAIPIEWKEQ